MKPSPAHDEACGRGTLNDDNHSNLKVEGAPAMEHQYIWFQTAPGFVVGCLGAIIAFALSLWMLFTTSATWGTVILVFTGPVVLLAPGFIIDQRIRRQRRHSDTPPNDPIVTSD